MAWAKEQVRIETLKYKRQNQAKTVLIPFHADRSLDYHQQNFLKGDISSPQAVYYQLGFDRICRKIRDKHHFHYDINAILSDLIYTRILELGSKSASYWAAWISWSLLLMRNMMPTGLWMSLLWNVT